MQYIGYICIRIRVCYLVSINDEKLISISVYIGNMHLNRVTWDRIESRVQDVLNRQKKIEKHKKTTVPRVTLRQTCFLRFRFRATSRLYVDEHYYIYFIHTFTAVQDDLKIPKNQSNFSERETSFLLYIYIHWYIFSLYLYLQCKPYKIFLNLLKNFALHFFKKKYILPYKELELKNKFKRRKM